LKSWLFFVYNEIKRRRLDRMDELLAIIKQQTSTIEQLTNELTLLREQVEYLRQKLYGKSSEKVVHQPGQLSLFGEESLPEEEADLPS
jgi:poly-gamma-glutamate capsule biosynthesis protein CapA/YwtB (metallophosphatase superfamily)